MKRAIQDNLIEWKNNSRRKPLIIKGARQVGKTWLAEELGKDQFKTFVKADLERQPDLHRLFKTTISPKKIIEELEFYSGTRIIPGESLLFLDEVQACPRALTALRYFFEEVPALHVIAAGSLIEFALGEISVPVGRVQYLHVYPMNFVEFLCALDKDMQAGYIAKDHSEVSEGIQSSLLEELRTYFFVGGMPEAVNVYRETRSLLEVFSVQSEIIESYRDDFGKYAPRADKTCLDAVLNGVARLTGEQIQYTGLDKHHSIPTVHKAFDLLNKAGVIHKIQSVSPSGIPLKGSANSRRFKAAVLDIGIMQRLCRVPADEELKNDDLSEMYRGKLAEQFVAQELAAAHNSEVYYWSREKRGSSAEVDFLVVREGKIYPVEVKSGTQGRLRSLHLLLEKYPNCPEGLVLYSGAYTKRPEQKLLFIPLYCAGSLHTMPL
jgi:predicted AAA+ superfamily ATPase